MSRRSKDCQIEKRCLNHELALDASLLGGGRTPREAIHCTTIIARRALSPSTPRAYGATLRASGVDRSARPSKEIADLFVTLCFVSVCVYVITAIRDSVVDQL